MELVASVVSCPLDRSSLALWHKGIMGMVTKWPCSGLQSHVCSLSSGHTDLYGGGSLPKPEALWKWWIGCGEGCNLLQWYSDCSSRIETGP